MCSRCIHGKRSALLLIAAAVERAPMLADEIIASADSTEIAHVLAEIIAEIIPDPVNSLVLPGLQQLRQQEEAERA